MEEFKQCNFSYCHLIGNNGTVKSSLKRTINRYGTGILKGLTKDDGYRMYWINNKWHYEHQLVAQHFIPNPNNYKEINHIDGNKSNNHYSNLEWSTRKLNIQHSFDVLGRETPKGKDHWNYNKKATQATKTLMSQKKTGINHPKFKGYYIYNNTQYTSSQQLANVLNTYNHNVIKWCKKNLNGCSFKEV